MATQGYAAWWDNPDASKNDTPVIRHAPDDNNYHLPDYDMLRKMRGSLVGRFAVIPAANRDGTSKGFDPNVAGPVHVDPDAPDGGVIFDPNAVDNRHINGALATSQYPHQVFYRLGTPAPLLGFGRGRFRDQSAQEEPRINPVRPGDYVVPKAANDGRQMEIPNFISNGMTPAAYNPAFYHAQEEQRVNTVPPLASLPPLSQPAPMPAPAPVAAPVHPSQYQNPGQMPYQQPTQPFYAPPPAVDPGLQNMLGQLMQGMVSMQQQVVALQQQRQPVYPSVVPPTTGVSNQPMPQGPPPGLATLPVGGQAQGGRNQYNENYDDETARPINQRVRRNKQTQRVEQIEEEEQPARPVRRASPPRNSLVEQDQVDRQQTVREFQQAAEDVQDGVITGFETLQLPWLTGPLANKAKRIVYLEIPGAGKHLGRFHDVIDSEACVVLVYDTRYEDGHQYLPPDTGEVKLKLSVPHLKKTFVVSSMGLHYACGAIDHIVLIKHDSESLTEER